MDGRDESRPYLTLEDWSLTSATIPFYSYFLHYMQLRDAVAYNDAPFPLSSFNFQFSVFNKKGALSPPHIFPSLQKTPTS